MSGRTVRSTVALCAAAALGTAIPATASAASPGTNGRIAFEEAGVIYSITATGSGRQKLTNGPDDHSPRWSPNGKTIAFERGGDIWTMKADGSREHQLTSGPGDDISPGWSPDGKKIVFVRSDDGSATGRSMFVKPLAGGMPSRVTTADDGCANAPTWTANNKFVVYADDCLNDSPSIRKVDLATGVISDVLGTGGVAGPGGQWHFKGSAPDVTPDSKSVLFTVGGPTDACGIGITDLSGGGFRQVVQGGDCGVFFADDPAASPNGEKVVYTGGNEAPQLDVVPIKGTNQCCGYIYAGLHAPLNADWQPKP